MIFGYARVSTYEQDHTLQLDALHKAGVEEVITDTMSGTKRDRPGLTRLLDKVREGDVIVVWRLDRLARSLSNLLELVDTLNKKGVSLRSLHEEINTASANGRLILHIFGALGEFEASLVKERTTAALIAARERGRKGGRKPALTEEQRRMARAMIKDGIPKSDVAKHFGISRAALYRNLEGDTANV